MHKVYLKGLERHQKFFPLTLQWKRQGKCSFLKELNSDKSKGEIRVNLEWKIVFSLGEKEPIPYVMTDNHDVTYLK